MYFIDSYPTSPAEVEVRSECMDEDDLFDLKTFLNQSSETTAPRSLERLVEIALQWLREGDIDVSGKILVNNEYFKGLDYMLTIYFPNIFKTAFIC